MPEPIPTLTALLVYLHFATITALVLPIVTSLFLSFSNIPLVHIEFWLYGCIIIQYAWFFSHMFLCYGPSLAHALLKQVLLCVFLLVSAAWLVYAHIIILFKWEESMEGVQPSPYVYRLFIANMAQLYWFIALALIIVMLSLCHCFKTKSFPYHSVEALNNDSSQDNKPAFYKQDKKDNTHTGDDDAHSSEDIEMLVNDKSVRSPTEHSTVIEPLHIAASPQAATATARKPTHLKSVAHSLAAFRAPQRPVGSISPHELDGHDDDADQRARSPITPVFDDMMENRRQRRK